MNVLKRILFTIGMGLLLACPARATLRVVATTPDLADITTQVGGKYVKVDSLAKGTEDIHAVPQRPSFIPKLNRADAVVLLGLDAEHAFLPALTEVAQNPNILPGHQGYIDCSIKINVMDAPAVISRTEGDQHPQGNPHYNTDPRKGLLMADTIAEGLSRLDSAHAGEFHQNAEAFKKGLNTKIAEWRQVAAPLKGVKAVSYHPSMVYFADFLGLDMVGTIELKPGIAPTPHHLEGLVGLMKEQKVPLILREVQYSLETAQWIANQTGSKIATVATMGGAFPDSGTYIGMIDHNVHAILAADGK